MTPSVPRPIGVSRRPVPRVDGPYDDELGDAATPRVEGSLALAFPPPMQASVPLRLAPPAAGDRGPELPERQPLPDLRGWTARLSQALVEVLAGARPAAQLSRFATLDVLAMLERGAGRLGARDGRPGRRPLVASVRVSQPLDGVAEVCATVDTGPRRRAIAMRLEGDAGRWRCTALQLG